MEAGVRPSSLQTTAAGRTATGFRERDLSRDEEERRAQRLRLGIRLGIVLLWAVALAGLHLTMQRERATAQTELEVALEAAAVAGAASVATERARIDAWLGALRNDLREQGRWSEAFSPGTEGNPAFFDREVETRLGRSFATEPSLVRLELVVAGHEGLRALGWTRNDETGSRRLAHSPQEWNGIAKALWYGHEIHRAVRAAGRRVERGEAVDGPEGDEPAALQTRVAIGVHAPGELVQAALVATLDQSAFARTLAGGVDPPITLTLLPARVAADAAVSDAAEAGVPDRAARRRAHLAARVLAAEGGGVTRFQAGEALVAGQSIGAEGERALDRIVLAEAPVPAGGLAGWQSPPWRTWAGLVTLLALAGLVGAGWFGRDRTSEEGVNASPDGVEAALAEAVSTEQPEGRPVSAALAAPIEPTTTFFGLRDWLADIRACLGREAASRGLGLDVRCERTLHGEIESDPAWLGGLVVALGREALDATPEERIALEFRRDEEDGLVVEFDTGGVDLAPIARMDEAALALGASLEQSARAGLLLRLPEALA